MVDLDAIRSLLGDEDDEFLAELIRTYLLETACLVPRLGGSSADPEEIRIVSHRLRGAAASMALAALATAWADVEEMAGHPDGGERLAMARRLQSETCTALESILPHLAR